MNKPPVVSIFFLPSATDGAMGSVELPALLRFMRPVTFGLWVLIFTIQVQQAVSTHSEMNWLVLLLSTVLFGGVHIQFWYEESEQGRRFHRTLDRMRGQIYEDDTTGLPNSRHFVFQLRRQMTRSVRNGRGFSLVLITFAGPQNVATSERVLTASARSLRQVVSDCDFVARLQGPNFGAIVLDEGTMTATDKAGRIKEWLAANVPEALHGHIDPIVAITGYAGELEVRDFLHRAQRDLMSLRTGAHAVHDDEDATATAAAGDDPSGTRAA